MRSHGQRDRIVLVTCFLIAMTTSASAIPLVVDETSFFTIFYSNEDQGIGDQNDSPFTFREKAQSFIISDIDTLTAPDFFRADTYPTVYEMPPESSSALHLFIASVGFIFLAAGFAWRRFQVKRLANISLM